MLSTWGDFSSVSGLIVGLIGFAITISNIFQTKSAAVAASEAAQRAVSAVDKFDLVVELTAAIATFDEIAKLHRDRLWEDLPERFTFLRRKLITIKSVVNTWTAEDSAKIQVMVDQLHMLQQVVERHLAGSEAIDPLMVSRILHRQLDQATEMQALLRQKLRG